MSAMASQITSHTILCSPVCSGAIMITPCLVIPPINGVRKFQPDSQCYSFYVVRMSELIKATDVWPVVIAANVVIIERAIVVISSTKTFAEPNPLCVSNQWTCLLDRQYLESVNKRVHAYNWFVSILVSATHTRTHSDVWMLVSLWCQQYTSKPEENKIVCIVFRLKLFVDCPPRVLRSYHNNIVLELQFISSYFPWLVYITAIFRLNFDETKHRACL